MQSAIETSSHTGPAPRYSNETVDGGCKDCIAKFQLRQSIFVHRSPGTLLSSTSSWLQTLSTCLKQNLAVMHPNEKQM